MPIEIKELLIKVKVENTKNIPVADAVKLSSEVKAQIIRDCVEKVMEKLDNKFER